MESITHPAEDLNDRINAFIGDVIGGVSGEEVGEVIENLESRGYLVHGIKDESYYRHVKTDGVAPLTPEDIVDGEGKGTGTSFWTSGVRVFHSGKPDFSGWATYDTTFFHWAHARGNPAGIFTMNIALTSLDRLRKIGVVTPSNGTKNGYVTLSSAVPPEALSLLKVRVHVNPDQITQANLRKIGQIAEQKMFHLLAEVSSKGIQPNSEKIVDIDASQFIQPLHLAA